MSKIINWAVDFSYDNSVKKKNVAAFCLYPSYLSGAKFKKEWIFQGSLMLNSASWLLVITPVEVYNGKEEVGQKEVRNVQFKERTLTHLLLRSSHAWKQRD